MAVWKPLIKLQLKRLIYDADEELIALLINKHFMPWSKPLKLFISCTRLILGSRVGCLIMHMIKQFNI